MKKLTLTLATASLTASLGAFAALPTDAAPFQLIVPNLKSGIDITLEGLYLQPTNSDLDYATTAATNVNTSNDGTVTTTTNNTQVQSVDPDYNFGFRVGLGYTFEDSGNDVQLNWTHFNHTDSSNVTAAPGSVLTSRSGLPFTALQNQETFVSIEIPSPTDDFPDGVYIFEGNGIASGEASSSSKVKTKLDAIDLDVGQYIDVGTRLRMRLFAGLRFAQVSSDMTNTYNSTEASSAEGPIIFCAFGDSGCGIAGGDVATTSTNSATITEQLNSKFTGIGPRVGVDSVYHIGNCFGVVTHAAVALLVGQVESSTSIHGQITAVNTIVGNAVDGSITGTSTRSTSVTLNSDDVTRAVPAIDAKLGLNFTHVFDNQSELTIEGGYQATQYIDAVDRLDPIADFETQINEDGTAFVPVGSKRTTSSVGFNGPYLSLNWKV